MSEKIEITREMLTGARDYVPNAEKEAWVAENAAKCFDRLAITSDGEELPTMYMVNEGLRRRFLMTAFVKTYLRQKAEADERDETVISESCYDKWAGSHVFNQMERMKKDENLRDKCFDLLADYKDLEKRFSAQLAGLLTVQNDSVVRQAQYTSTQMKALPGLLDELKKLADRKGEADGKTDG